VKRVKLIGCIVVVVATSIEEVFTRIRVPPL